MEYVEEKSTSYLTTVFKDKDDNLIVPTTVSYRVDCPETQGEIRADTNITPASSVEIELTPTDNTIQSASRPNEGRCVTVTATYGSGGQIVREYRYVLRNLQFKI